MDSDDVAEAAEALAEFEGLDVDNGVDNLVDLFPPDPQDVLRLFDTMSVQLRRAIRTVRVGSVSCSFLFLDAPCC